MLRYSLFLLFFLGQFSLAVEDILVTGQYVPRSLQTSSNVVSVLDRQAIARLQVQNTADVLRAIPGVLVNQEGGAGGTVSISLRGGEPNFTVVMIDGVPVNDPTNTRGGSFDLSTVAVDAIERIEIVRGPQSAIYGSGALSGVINILTRAEAAQSGQRLTVSGTEYGGEAYGYQGRLRQSWGSVDLGLNKLHSADAVAGSHLASQEASLGFVIQPVSVFSLSGGARWQEAEKTSYPEQSGGPELAASDDLDTSDNRDLTAYLDLGLGIASWWRMEVRADHFDHELELDSPGIAPYDQVPANGYVADYQRRSVRWLNQFSLGESIELVAGADRVDEQGDSIGYVQFEEIPPDALLFLLGLPELPVGFPANVPLSFTLDTDFAMSREIDGMFAELAYLSASGFSAQASIRRDEPDSSDGELSRKAGLRYPLADGRWVLSGNWGEGFKLPSFFALGHSLTGNPDLKPEKARSADVSVEWNGQSGEGLRVTAFRNRFNDLIDFDPDSFSNVNRSQVDTSGAELEARWQPVDQITVSGHATYTDIDVADSDRQLAGRPQWKAGAGVDWRWARNWQWGLQYYWQSESHATSLHTGETTEHDLASYQRVDTSVSWQAMPGLQLQLSLQNALDEDYQEAVGFPGYPRLLSGRLSYQW